MTNVRRTLAGSLALALLCLAVYWPGLAGGFLFDDYANLVLDPDWKVTALEWSQWRRAALHGIASDSGRGLAMLSFAANHYFTGLDPWPMKATNLMMHLGNSILVLLLSRRLLAKARQSGPAPGEFAAWAITAAWMVHPLQVSSVHYIVQRMEIGAQGFTLLSLLCYVIARDTELVGRRAWPWLAASVAAMAMGLGFKESALLLPLFALLVEWTLYRFKSRDGHRSPAWIRFHLSMILVGIAVYLIVVLPRYLPAEAYSGRDFSLYERLITQPRVLWMYVGQVLWPAPQHLVFYYDQVRASTGLLQPPSTLWSLLGITALAALALASVRRLPLFSLGLGWFLVAHAVTSNVVPLELAFEHRNYLALLGILLAIAGLLTTISGAWEVGTRRLLMVLPVLTLAGLCFLQSLTWSTPVGLATSLASRNPDSARASYALATEWFGISGDNPDNLFWNLAFEEFGNAANQERGSGAGEQGQIIMLSRSGLPVPDKIWNSLRARLQGAGSSAEQESLLYTLVNCRVRSDCRLDDAQLQRTLARAVDQKPNSPVLHAQYANFAFNIMRDPPLALDLMREASRLAPNEPAYLAGLLKFMLASKLHAVGEVDAGLMRLRAANTEGQLDGEIAEIQALMNNPSQGANR